MGERAIVVVVVIWIFVFWMSFFLHSFEFLFGIRNIPMLGSFRVAKKAR